MMRKKIKPLLILCLSVVALWSSTAMISFNIVVNDNPIDHCALIDVQDSIWADDGPVTLQSLVKDMGVTDKSGASSLISAELGINLTNDSPYEDGWIWFPAVYLSENSLGDVYSITVPAEEIPESGLFYLLSRFALPDSQFVYGAYDSNRNTGGKWDGTHFTAPLIHFIRESAIKGVPENFALHAPYPNPFNPGTRINFDIAEDTKLSLNVFDLNGKKVREIWSGQCDAGYYSKFVDMSGFASGIYIVQMLTPTYRNVHKILLVK